MSVLDRPASEHPQTASALVRDPVFATALDTCSLVEASAGTGKTYALAGLFARAVIVERLRVPQILAVTYTVAATQELHERVRLRLQHAAELAAQWREGDPAAVAGDKPETALLRQLLHQALHAESRESLPALRLRLQRAQRELDLAAITTIHGFCQRVLAEHALDTGQPLLAATLEPATRAQRLQLAIDLWREFGGEPAGADFLRREFSDLPGLAKALRDLLAPEPLLPSPASSLPSDPLPRLQAVWTRVRELHAEQGARASAAITDALNAKVLNANKYRAATLETLWQALQMAVQSAEPPPQLPEKLERLTPDKLRDGCSAKGQGREPRFPLFDAIAELLDVHAQRQAWREAADLQCLHALRAAAFQRDAARKLAYNVRDFDDLVGAVHAAVSDPATATSLAAALRKQFPLALVDEFQDTDARQWTIFNTLFGAGSDDAARGGLVLVGDPKQAIYRFRGGDVHTYLQAAHVAQAAAALDRNFRSRPSVLTAVNALFDRAPDAALGAGIGFTATHPGGNVADADYLLDGMPAPALYFHTLPSPGVDNKGVPKDWNKPESIAYAARLCALAIRNVLQQARDGRAQRRDRGALRALEPRDCAVLVRTHDEAIAVREALATLNVPAVAAGRRSLFDSEEAQELLTLLLALANPGDTRRLRAALATRLLGFDAGGLRALDDDSAALLRWQQTFDAWRMRWEQHGPQALLAQVAAENAARLLGRFDGERRLTQLLQLAELLQEARAGRLGTQGQIDWLHTRIATADPEDETQWPRLESDAGRVQVMTLHASKGLEFPLVFLPFAGLGRSNGSRDFVVYQHEGQRVRRWKTVFPDPRIWEDAKREAEREDAAEDMRLLYVGLTRARDTLWLCGGALSNSGSALCRLLGGTTMPPALIATLGDTLRCPPESLPDDSDVTPLPAEQAAHIPAPRTAQRKLRRDWWIHSFSQLHRQRPHGTHALHEETPATDERPLATAVVIPAVDPRFRGERFGNAVHHALEHADFAAWRDHADASPPSAELPVLLAALQAQDYGEADSADGVRELTRLVADTLNAPLPEGGRLCDLPAHACVAEIEFHFTLADADSGALLALLHRHGIALDRRDFGAWPQLSGLMNGKIDLTYRNDGRLYVLDYKSNLLPDYAPATLAATMRASEYDLQALLYVVALHRWLRLRLGAAYDYARDFGGVRYVFCRGLERRAAADGESARGIVAPVFDQVLIEAVGALLAPNGGRA
jgi:exodeoxyribonuclease V beta subunit